MPDVPECGVVNGAFDYFRVVLRFGEVTDRALRFGEDCLSGAEFSRQEKIGDNGPADQRKMEPIQNALAFES